MDEAPPSAAASSSYAPWTPPSSIPGAGAARPARPDDIPPGPLSPPFPFRAPDTPDTPDTPDGVRLAAAEAARVGTAYAPAAPGARADPIRSVPSAAPPFDRAHEAPTAPMPRFQPSRSPGMPAAPPQYDPQQFAGGFGAAGGAPPAGVPPLPRGHDTGGPTPTRAGATLRAAVLIGVVSAVIASSITAGLFLLYDRSSTTAASTSSTSLTGASAPAALNIYALLDRAQPSVVSILTDTRTGATSEPLGAGSGVIISADGLVLTNAHVVAGASAMKVGLFDGSTHSATLVGSFPDSDVALVKITDPVELVPAELGSSADIKVGDPVVAIGNALNLGAAPSVTEGIVSAKDRDILTREGHLKNLIQTDAAINPGNSGGPLIDASGRVVGINTAIINNAQNIGFAISIDEIKPLIEDLKDGKGTVTPDTAFLGVSTSSVGDVTDAVRKRYGVTADEGAFVSDVVPGSAADGGGLQPGDVITSIDGKAVTSSADVGAVIRTKKPGDEVVIEYEREGQPATATVTLTSRAESGN